MSFPEKIDKRFNGLIMLLVTVLVVLTILFFGLRPKTWPLINEVQWLVEEQALLFQPPSVAYLKDFKGFEDSQFSGDFTFHIAVAAENLEKIGFRPILMLHGGDDDRQLVLWHWGRSVIVMNGDDYDYTEHHPRLSPKSSGGLLREGKKTLITVSSSKQATRLYIDGNLVAEKKDWQLTIPANTKGLRLLLGNSVYGKHGWAGKIYSLAFYIQSFSPAEVKNYFENWSRQTAFLAEKEEQLILLYLFSQPEKGQFRDLSGRNRPLLLPSRPVVLNKTYLSTPWHHFSASRSFFIDAIINLFGFMPLGAVLYYWLQQVAGVRQYQKLITLVLLCFLMSLGIEVAQVWLPSRSSSLLDLTMNSLGGLAGALSLIKIQTVMNSSLEDKIKMVAED